MHMWIKQLHIRPCTPCINFFLFFTNMSRRWIWIFHRIEIDARSYNEIWSHVIHTTHNELVCADKHTIVRLSVGYSLSDVLCNYLFSKIRKMIHTSSKNIHRAEYNKALARMKSLNDITKVLWGKFCYTLHIVPKIEYN